MTRLFTALRSTFYFVFLFSLLLFVNLLQTLSLAVLPFSRRTFRSFNRGCANFWWGTCVLAATHLNKARLVVSGDPLPMRENAIVIVNHQSMSDILMLMMLASSKGRLGDLKFFIKDILKYVPGIGWGMLFLDNLFVKRDWNLDKSKITRVFSKYQVDRIPIWLVSFVEGTRLTKAKLKRSQIYAKDHGLPVFKNVLVPRTKGFVASLHGLSGHAVAVYDLTIAHGESVPSLWKILNGDSKEFHVHVKRYEIADLPQGGSEHAKWLIERFSEKDKILENFYRDGVFNSGSVG